MSSSRPLLHNVMHMHSYYGVCYKKTVDILTGFCDPKNTNYTEHIKINVTGSVIAIECTNCILSDPQGQLTSLDISPDIR